MKRPYVVITHSEFNPQMKFASIIEASSPEEAVDLKLADSSLGSARVVAVTASSPLRRSNPLSGSVLNEVTIENKPTVKIGGYYR